MADYQRQQHRPNRISVPPRGSATASSRSYPFHPYTPTPTPSKTRLSFNSKSSGHKSSISFLFLILFSLRSLYSLLPFLRSSPSFSLFPFSFLVSLLSFLLSLTLSLFNSRKKDPFFRQNYGVFSLSSLTPAQRKLFLCKSLLLAIVFLLRFQALRYCGAAAMILAELSGTVAARFVAEGKKRDLIDSNDKRSSKVRGFCFLVLGSLLLSVSWDRIDCFPFSASFIEKWGFSFYPRENCFRIWPMLLPFLSGFLGSYEKVSMNWGAIRQIDRKLVRSISLFFTTVLLFIPAVVSFMFFEGDDNGVSFGNLGWPLVNTVVFGVLLSENYSDDKPANSIDFEREFLVTFFCTIVLELFYFPELSLWGLLLCGLLLYIAVRDLDSVNLSYHEIGLEPPESFVTLFMKPIRHILSERKSRKIALFLLINAGYMVVEFAAGFMSNSLGLISDACHMLFDCAALAIGLYASYISRLPANNQFNYGRGRFEVLSGYVNAVFLVLVGALIVLESLERILDPQEISTNSLLVVSVGGLVVNIVGLIFFHEEHHHAHGGSGCLHSHSPSQSHQHLKHDYHGHHEDIMVSHEHRHHDHLGSVDVCEGFQKIEGSKCNDHHNTHDHHHEHHSHDHHHHHDDEHNHNHDQHSHDHHHDQHSHHRRHDHHSHDHHHDHHSHDHHHDHHSHDHHHDHDSHGHHHDHDSHDHHPPSSDSKTQGKHHHRHIDHNMEGIFLHVLADTMGSVGVVISTLLIKYKGWLVADPACSIFISIMIVASVIPLLRNSAEILLQRVPRTQEHDLREAVKDIMNINGLRGIQKLHVWSFTNTDIVGTLHLLVSKPSDKAFVKTRVSHMLEDAGVKDLTLQVECVR